MTSEWKKPCFTQYVEYTVFTLHFVQKIQNVTYHIKVLSRSDRLQLCDDSNVVAVQQPTPTVGHWCGTQQSKLVFLPQGGTTISFVTSTFHIAAFIT